MTPDRFSAFPAEREWLRRQVAERPGQWVIEAGCFRGVTSAVLADACDRTGKRLVCVDPWDGRTDESGEAEYEAFTAATAKYVAAGVVVVNRGDRLMAASPYCKCVLVFIDGDHRYPATLEDMNQYWPFVAPGGVLAVHDSFDEAWGEGVRRAVHEFAAPLAPVVVNHFVYYPTPAEVAAHDHRVSGIAWIEKPL